MGGRHEPLTPGPSPNQYNNVLVYISLAHCPSRNQHSSVLVYVSSADGERARGNIRNISLKVHKFEIFFGFDFEI